METLIIAVIAGIGFILAYHTYGKWLGKTIFRISATAVCPSTELRDDIDFVPTPRSIIFGYHFTSIAGTTLDTACRLQRYVVQELRVRQIFR
jgi:carbon starvation protein